MTRADPLDTVARLQVVQDRSANDKFDAEGFEGALPPAVGDLVGYVEADDACGDEAPPASHTSRSLVDDTIAGARASA
jgi:hypothetical protein